MRSQPVAVWWILFQFLPLISLLAQSPQVPQPLILQTETIQGDLVLSGSQVKTVQNTHLIVNGTIYLSGNAQLIAHQSIIEIIHYPRQELFANDSALVQADTTLFESFIHSTFNDKTRLVMNNCFLINLIALNSSAQATIRNSTIFQDRFGLVQAEGQSSALIENSVVGAIGLFIPSTPAVTIDSLRPGYFTHWSAQEKISTQLGFNITLNNTEVKDNPGYSGGFEMGWNIFAASNDTLTVSNSVLNKIVINFSNEDVQISNLATRTPVNFSLKAIRLANTTIQNQWGIFVTNGQTTINNSKGIWLWPVGNKNTVVTNSEISEADPRGYTGTLTLNNSTMTDGFEIYDSSAFRMEGTVSITESGPLFTPESRVTRNFEVDLVKGIDGSAMPATGLVLSRNGTDLWRGTSDAAGKVRFDVTFDAVTSQQDCILTSLDTTIRLRMVVGLTNSNPVVIGFEQFPNDPHWVPVAYVDQNAASGGSGTKSLPFLKIQDGINGASGGGVVRVAQGNYIEDITLKSDVVLSGAGPGLSTIGGNVIASGISGAEINGFTIKDTNTAGINCSHAGLRIVRNVITGQPDDGIFSDHSTLTIVNNVIDGNGHNGILLIDSSSATIRNNIVLLNAQAGISSDQVSTAVITYNDVWGNTGPGYGGRMTGDNTNISADPLFRARSSGDYILLPGSPCIDAGDPAQDVLDAGDPQRPGFALWPSQGTRRSDMGVFGGSWVTVATIPQLFSPPDGATGQSTSVTLMWNSVPSISRYWLEVGRDQGFSSLLVSDSTLTATSRSVSTLANSSTYYWKVGAPTGLFSSVERFTTAAALPLAPVLASPADTTRNIPLTVTLGWNSVAGAQVYHLQLSTASDFSTRLVDDSTITVTTRNVGPLSLATTYYWRVRAKNSVGFGPFSTAGRFRSDSHHDG